MPEGINAGTVYAALQLNTNNFEQGLQKASSQLNSSADQMANRMEKLKGVMNGVSNALLTVGTVGAGGMTAMVKMANEAIESENLFTTALGNNAQAVKAWSEGLRADLGLNSIEVRKNAATFYAMFDSMKMGEENSLKLSKSMTQLAYDMSSFYNLDPSVAFEKLRSGISGEIEPLKQLGIMVNETTVKAYALTNGLMKQGETLSEQGKVMARYGVIMEATAKAQGDLARTADSPTNLIRAIGNEAKQTAIEFGKLLVPLEKDLLLGLKKFTSGLDDMSSSQKRQTVIMAEWGIGLALVIGTVLKGAVALTEFIATVKTIQAAMILTSGTNQAASVMNVNSSTSVAHALSTEIAARNANMTAIEKEAAAKEAAAIRSFYNRGVPSGGGQAITSGGVLISSGQYQSAIEGQNNLNRAVNDGTKATQGFGAAQKAAFSPVAGTLWSIAIIAAIAIVVEAWKAYDRQQHKALDNLNDEQKGLERTIADNQKKAEKIKDLADAYEDLSKKTSLSKDEHEKLGNINKQLSVLLGGSKDAINSQTGAFNGNTKAALEYARALEESRKANIRLAMVQADISVQEGYKAVKDAVGFGSKIQKAGRESFVAIFGAASIAETPEVKLKKLKEFRRKQDIDKTWLSEDDRKALDLAQAQLEAAIASRKELQAMLKSGYVPGQSMSGGSDVDKTTTPSTKTDKPDKPDPTFLERFREDRATLSREADLFPDVDYSDQYISLLESYMKEGSKLGMTATDPRMKAVVEEYNKLKTQRNINKTKKLNQDEANKAFDAITLAIDEFDKSEVIRKEKIRTESAGQSLVNGIWVNTYPTMPGLTPSTNTQGTISPTQSTIAAPSMFTDAFGRPITVGPNGWQRNTPAMTPDREIGLGGTPTPLITQRRLNAPNPNEPIPIRKEDLAKYGFIVKTDDTEEQIAEMLKKAEKVRINMYELEAKEIQEDLDSRKKAKESRDAISEQLLELTRGGDVGGKAGSLLAGIASQGFSAAMGDWIEKSTAKNGAAPAIKNLFIGKDGKPNKYVTGAAALYTAYNTAESGGALSGGLAGAEAGMTIGGPWGAAIGALAGAIFGGSQESKRAEERAKAIAEAQLEELRRLNNAITPVSDYFRSAGLNSLPNTLTFGGGIAGQMADSYAIQSSRGVRR